MPDDTPPPASEHEAHLRDLGVQSDAGTLPEALPPLEENAPATAAAPAPAEPAAAAAEPADPPAAPEPACAPELPPAPAAAPAPEAGVLTDLRARLEVLSQENARLVRLTSLTGTPPARLGGEVPRHLSERDLRRLAAEHDA